MTQNELLNIMSEVKTKSFTYGVNWGFKALKFNLDSYIEDYNLNLNPTYQRGHVWSQEQQIAFIEALHRGLIKETIIKFNIPLFNIKESENTGNESEATCIDGLQRLTALMEFQKGNFKIFDNRLSYQDFLENNYSYGAPIFIEVYEINDRKELLKFYLDLNFGGKPHSQSEFNRISEEINKL